MVPNYSKSTQEKGKKAKTPSTKRGLSSTIQRFSKQNGGEGFIDFEVEDTINQEQILAHLSPYKRKRPQRFENIDTSPQRQEFSDFLRAYYNEEEHALLTESLQTSPQNRDKIITASLDPMRGPYELLLKRHKLSLEKAVEFLELVFQHREPNWSRHKDIIIDQRPIPLEKLVWEENMASKL